MRLKQTGCIAHTPLWVMQARQEFRLLAGHFLSSSGLSPLRAKICLAGKVCFAASLAFIQLRLCPNRYFRYSRKSLRFDGNLIYLVHESF